jgi:modification methylase
MKALNDDKQMRSEWIIPICSGVERLRSNGRKAHSTQKPEALLYRVILSSSRPGDVILDPFFGSGTTGVVARRLHRHWLGIEQEAAYIELAARRIAAVTPESYLDDVFDVSDKKRLAPRVPFSRLLEFGLLLPGQSLYFQADRQVKARIKPNGKLRLPDGFEGSIHQVGRHLLDDRPCNGWQLWHYEDEAGQLHLIDHLRDVVREKCLAGD